MAAEESTPEAKYGTFGVEYFIDEREAEKVQKNFEKGMKTTQSQLDKFVKGFPEAAKKAGQTVKEFIVPDTHAGAKVLGAPAKLARWTSEHVETLAGMGALADTAYLQEQLQNLNTTLFSGAKSLGEMTKGVNDLTFGLHISTDTAMEAVTAMAQYGQGLLTNNNIFSKQSEQIMANAIKMQKAWNVSLEDGVDLQSSLTRDMHLSTPQMNKFIAHMKSVGDATGQTMTQMFGLYKQVRDLSMILGKEQRGSFVQKSMESMSVLRKFGFELDDVYASVTEMSSAIKGAQMAPKFAPFGIAPGMKEYAENPLKVMRAIGKQMANMPVDILEEVYGWQRSEIEQLERLGKLSEEQFQLQTKQADLDKDWAKARGTLAESTGRLATAFRGLYRQALMPIVNILSKVVSGFASIIEGVASLANEINKFTGGYGSLLLLFFGKLAITYAIVLFKLNVVKKLLTFIFKLNWKDPAKNVTLFSKAIGGLGATVMRLVTSFFTFSIWNPSTKSITFFEKLSTAVVGTRNAFATLGDFITNKNNFIGKGFMSMFDIFKKNSAAATTASAKDTLTMTSHLQTFVDKTKKLFSAESPVKTWFKTSANDLNKTTSGIRPGKSTKLEATKLSLDPVKKFFSDLKVLNIKSAEELASIDKTGFKKRLSFLESYFKNVKTVMTKGAVSESPSINTKLFGKSFNDVQNITKDFLTNSKVLVQDFGKESLKSLNKFSESFKFGEKVSQNMRLQNAKLLHTRLLQADLSYFKLFTKLWKKDQTVFVKKNAALDKLKISKFKFFNKIMLGEQKKFNKEFLKGVTKNTGIIRKEFDSAYKFATNSLKSFEQTNAKEILKVRSLFGVLKTDAVLAGKAITGTTAKVGGMFNVIEKLSQWSGISKEILKSNNLIQRTVMLAFKFYEWLEKTPFVVFGDFLKWLVKSIVWVEKGVLKLGWLFKGLGTKFIYLEIFIQVYKFIKNIIQAVGQVGALIYKNFQEPISKAWAVIKPFWENFKKGVGVVFGLLKKLGPVLGIAFTTIIIGLTTGFGWIIAAVFAVIVSFNLLYGKWGELTDGFKNGLTLIGKGFKEVFFGIGKILWNFIKTAWYAAATMGNLAVLDVAGARKSAAKGMASMAEMGGGVGDLISGLKDVFVGSYDTLAAAVQDGVLDADKQIKNREKAAEQMPMIDISGIYQGKSHIGLLTKEVQTLTDTVKETSRQQTEALVKSNKEDKNIEIKQDVRQKKAASMRDQLYGNIYSGAGPTIANAMRTVGGG